jgi:bifunctional non-homologous end joining protein LigD
VNITHPDRVIDAASGTTKQALAEYYALIAPWLLPQLQGRPVALLRAPEGVGHEAFFQKHLQRLSIPDATLLPPQLDAPHPPLIALQSMAAVLQAVQMGVIELHTWNALAASIERPDRLVFDLDPGAGLPWARVVEAAELTKTLLDGLGLASFVKTSGGKGLHIVVPLQRRHGWPACREFARSVSLHLAHTLPQRFADKMGESHREGKVFVDWLRNQRGATAAAAWSVRARPGLGVSVPLAWDELVTLRGGDHWTVPTVPQRLDELQRHDPWARYEQCRQTLTEAARVLREELKLPPLEDPAADTQPGELAALPPATRRGGPKGRARTP